MTLAEFHPALVLALGALAVLVTPPRFRPVPLLGFPLAALVLVLLLPDGATIAWRAYGYDLVPMRVAPLGKLFAIVFALMAFVGALFALRQRSVAELAAALVYAGSAIGVALAGDLITLFVFWETMALASTAIVLAAGHVRALRAAGRYFMFHMLGGALLLSGLLLHVADTGSLAPAALAMDSWGHWLMLAGVLVNVAAPPLSAWLPDAYPEASWSGAVFLSVFTTKTAVYVLALMFPGTQVLVWVGLLMIFHGILFATFENNIRRLLSYSIINQVGFMVVGVGIGTELALNGVAAHAFAHIVYKAMLLMTAGGVVYMTGRWHCTDLGGDLWRAMPLTAGCAVIGALTVFGFPLTSGFVSKSMISEASSGGAIASVVPILLTIAAAAVFLHAGLKYQWFVFFARREPEPGEPQPGEEAPGSREPPLNMRAAMGLCAFICIGLGVWPAPLYQLLPHPVEYAPYTWGHFGGSLLLVGVGAIAFFVARSLIRRAVDIRFDIHWLWRAPARRALAWAMDPHSGAGLRAVSERVLAVATRLGARALHPFRPEGLLGAVSVGAMVRNVLLALSLILVLAFLVIRNPASAADPGAEHSAGAAAFPTIIATTQER